VSLRLFEWEAPGPYRVAFSTRLGGVSEGSYASLNLGLRTFDEPQRVIENRDRLCRAVEADPQTATMAMQVHGARVVAAEPRGIVTRGVAYERCDGIWSKRPRQAMILLTADCLPIVLCRTDGDPAVAVLHVGWRGLLGGIVAAGARALGGPGLAASVGPGICGRCYRVGDDVATAFAERFGPPVVRDGSLDLRAAAERALREAGVEAVEHVDRCTGCEPRLFFSHRRDRGVTGRQGVIAYVA
jgi:polyphenol oxidase